MPCEAKAGIKKIKVTGKPEQRVSGVDACVCVGDTNSTMFPRHARVHAKWRGVQTAIAYILPSLCLIRSFAPQL
jgi:hypothetical protein